MPRVVSGELYLKLTNTRLRLLPDGADAHGDQRYKLDPQSSATVELNKTDLRELMVKSGLCLEPWNFSDRKESRWSKKTAALWHAACQRARNMQISYVAHAAARDLDLGPLPRTGQVAISSTYAAQYRRLRKLVAADWAATHLGADLNAPGCSTLPPTRATSAISQMVRDPGFEKHTGFDPKFDCYICQMPAAIRGYFVFCEHDHEADERDRLSVRNRKVCAVCNMGWLAGIDKVRKVGLREPQSKFVVESLERAYRREKRYFGK